MSEIEFGCRYIIYVVAVYCTQTHMLSHHPPRPAITTQLRGRFVNLLSLVGLATGPASQTEVLIPWKLGACSHDTIRYDPQPSAVSEPSSAVSACPTDPVHPCQIRSLSVSDTNYHINQLILLDAILNHINVSSIESWHTIPISSPMHEHIPPHATKWILPSPANEHNYCLPRKHRLSHEPKNGVLP
jgi:hypothetical protein